MRKTEFTVTEGDLEKDRADVLRLWSDGLNHPDPEKSFDWLFVDNPFARGTIFLLKSQENRPVDCQRATIGVLGISPRRWNVKGAIVDTVVVSDLVVCPAYRTAGPALRLVKQSFEIMQNRKISPFAFPNARARAVTVRAGFKSVGEFARYAKLIRTRHKLSRHLPSIVASAIASIIDSAIWLDDLITARHIDSTSVGAGKWEAGFDSRFDELAENSRMCQVTGYRSSEFLQWRFFQGPIPDYRVFTAGLNDDCNKLAGYAVCRIEAGHVTIDDFFARDDDAIAKAVLCRLMLKLRELGAETVSIELLASASLLKFLKRLRFRKRESRGFFVAYNDENLARLISDSDQYYMTTADEDQ